MTLKSDAKCILLSLYLAKCATLTNCGFVKGMAESSFHHSRGIGLLHESAEAVALPMLIPDNFPIV